MTKIERKNISMMTTALYRHFDKDGVLLYVGISVDPISRTVGHLSSSEWYKKIHKVDIEWFDSRSEALDAEAISICIESPIFNIIRPEDRMMRVFIPISNWESQRSFFYGKNSNSQPFRMKTASEIVNYITKAALATRIGVTVDVVNLHSRKGVLPASWYHVCEQMAGRPLPRSLFSFKGDHQ